MTTTRLSIPASALLVLVAMSGCEDDSKAPQTFEEMEETIAEAEAKQGKKQQAEADAVFDKHESLGDACIREVDAATAEQKKAIKAGEEPDFDAPSPDCDAFWAAVKKDLPGIPERKLGLMWARWRRAHGKAPK